MKTLFDLRVYLSDRLFEKATTKEEKLQAIFIHPLIHIDDTGKDDPNM